MYDAILCSSQETVKVAERMSSCCPADVVPSRSDPKLWKPHGSFFSAGWMMEMLTTDDWIFYRFPLGEEVICLLTPPDGRTIETHLGDRSGESTRELELAEGLFVMPDVLQYTTRQQKRDRNFFFFEAESQDHEEGKFIFIFAYGFFAPFHHQSPFISGFPSQPLFREEVPSSTTYYSPQRGQYSLSPARFTPYHPPPSS